MGSLFKHVSRVFFSHKALTFVLGVILFLSSFIYTFISAGIGTVEEASEDYFDAHVQEDIAIVTSEILTPFDQDVLHEECPDATASDLRTLSRIDHDCFKTVVDERLDHIRAVAPSMAYEARFYKDLTLEESHNARLMMMHETINIPKLEKGSWPEDGEIALTRAYMQANGLTVGDTVHIAGEPLKVSGHVLFPDYTLPVFDEPLMFNSRMQTPGLVNEDTFAQFDTFTGVHFGGAGDDATHSMNAIREAEIPFVDSVSLTEEVMRSGAVYAEIQGSQMMALSIAVFTAATGIGVCAAFVSRMIERTKKPLGVLMALGMPRRTIFIAHLAFLSVASFGFALGGYALGHHLSPYIRDLFLSFYMLPQAPVSFSLRVVLVSVGVPLLVLNGIGFWVLHRLFKETPDALMRDTTGRKGVFIRPGLKKLRNMPFTLRMQTAFLSRHAGKTLIYLLALMTVFFMALVTAGMLDAFGKTLPDYYDSTRIESIGRCDYEATCPVPEGASKVYETSARVQGEPSLLIGLEPDDPIHPLHDDAGTSLSKPLVEGAVITKSHQLLSGLQKGERFMLEHGDEMLELEVTGVADLYAGNRVFIERAALAGFYTGEEAAFNTVYADHVLDGEDYLEVHRVDSILEQIDSIDRLMQSFINIAVGLSLAIGGLVIYLITRLSADDHSYTIAMLKVMGYGKREIRTYLLGGYLALSVFAFALAVPLALFTLNWMMQWLADYFNMVIPLAIPWGYVFIIIIIYGMIYALGIQSARKRVETLPLSEALKRTQL